MTKAHVTNTMEINEETVFTVEMVTEERVVTLQVESDELAVWITNGLEVTYEEEEAVEEALKVMKAEYITVDTFADGSNEHDVYSHKATVSGGVIEMDKTGNHLKSYKREASAMKFAESLNREVRKF